MKAQKGSRVIAVLFLWPRHKMVVGGQRQSTAALPPGELWYPFDRKLSGPQRRPGQVRKISPPPGFDARTVKSVAFLFSDNAIRAPNQRKSRIASKLYHHPITILS